MATIIQNIDISKILQLTPAWWKHLGGFIAKWVREDSKKGLFQNNAQHLAYRSRQYKKYKANDMRRFTDGKRLQAYRGQSIESNKTQFVDMTLTGKLKKGLRPRSWTKYSVTMGYNPEDAKKILGNKKYNRDVVGLNDKNKRLVKVELIKEFKKRQIEVIPKNITINIKG